MRLARTNHGPSFSQAVITFDLPARTSHGATAPTATVLTHTCYRHYELAMHACWLSSITRRSQQLSVCEVMRGGLTRWMGSPRATAARRGCDVTVRPVNHAR